MKKVIFPFITLMLFMTFIDVYSKNINSPNFYKTSTNKDIVVTGSVIDKETKQPLEYATISFFSIKENKIITGGITNTKGEFSISVPQGVYNISIEYISFKTITLKNKKIFNNEHLGIFSLEVDLESLSEVEIIAERTTVEIKLDKKIYNVGKDLTVSGGNVSDVLDNVPSVSVNAEGTVALRGNDNVRILINGKPSSLVGLSSTEALNQLPAESIQKVEVITSPSARYESEGTAGILNIILRRSKLQGLNGSITNNLGYPKTIGVSGNINYRVHNVNLFSTTSYRDRKSLGYWQNDVKYFDINTPDLDEKKSWINNREGLNTNTGIEWYINNSASVTSAIIYSNGNNKSNLTNNLLFFNKNTQEFTKNIRLKPEVSDNETIQYSINFDKKFKKADHKFTFDFQYEDSNQDDAYIIDENGVNTENVTNLKDKTRILLQSDYVVPLGKMSQFEIGFRGDFGNKITDLKVALLNTTSGNFEINNNLTNIFKFKQYITAVYSQFGSKLNNKFSYLLGLRTENTKITLDQPNTNNLEKKNLTGLFPTVNFNYELNNDESLSLGYNRRISRPRDWMLNPFPSRSSITNVFQGNPDLIPTYTDRFETGYLNSINKLTFSSSLYYAHAINALSFVSRKSIINGDEVILRGPVNIAKDNRYGLEFNVNYSSSKKWRINTDFNIFKLERKGDFNGINLGSNNLTWSARLTNKLTLPYKVNWQTNMNYRGPTADRQNNRKSAFSTNMAFSKDLFKEKASIVFNIRDLFSSRLHRNNITTDTFTSYQEIQFRGGRTYNISFTYRFNQKKKRERPNRHTSNGDDI